MHKIILMGNYPPPIGGVSVHIKRLYDKLIKEGFDVEIFDISQTQFDKNIRFLFRRVFSIIRDFRLRFIFFFLYSLVTRRKGILHIHIPLFSNPLFCIAIYLLSYRVLFTVHDQVALDLVLKRKGLSKNLILLLIRSDVKYIAVSEFISRQLVTLGVSPRNITVIPAFIPDDSTHTHVDSKIVSFLSEGTGVVFYASSDTIWNRDVYGIDFLIASLPQLKSVCPNIRLLVILPYKSSDEAQLNITKLNSEDWIFVTRDHINGLCPVFAHSSIYLRLTSTDGDAVAVREALSTNCRVIASDVCQRPEGCFIYKYLDLPNFISTIKLALSVPENTFVANLDFYAQIKEIYNNIEEDAK